MKINWKVRFKNKTWLVTFLLAILAFIYQVLGLFDIVTEEIDKVSVVKILISSGLEKPYYIKKQVMSPNGCFTRVGTSSQPMSTARSDEFYRKQIHNTRIGTE